MCAPSITSNADGWIVSVDSMEDIIGGHDLLP
jgi:hypothetical protein